MSQFLRHVCIQGMHFLWQHRLRKLGGSLFALCKLARTSTLPLSHSTFATATLAPNSLHTRLHPGNAVDAGYRRRHRSVQHHLVLLCIHRKQRNGDLVGFEHGHHRLAHRRGVERVHRVHTPLAPRLRRRLRRRPGGAADGCLVARRVLLRGVRQHLLQLRQPALELVLAHRGEHRGVQRHLNLRRFLFQLLALKLLRRVQLH
mmetsp:Transcript_7733/g.14564  ORF Transcript_7733/g.14564 Transcript_7733/m.14564 type:complete len:203 (-) Transcript_7733:3026-3634(-)